MEEHLTLVAAFAALITALTTLLVVWEMRKNRLSSFRPNFAVINSVIDMWVNKDGKIQFCNDGRTPDLFRNFSHLSMQVAKKRKGQVLQSRIRLFNAP